MKTLQLWFITMFSGLFFLFLAPRCLAQDPSLSSNSPEGEESTSRDSTDSNYLVVAAIKSISGEQPEDEFFAAFWRFKYGEGFYSLANLDIALSNRPTDSQSDSVTSPQRRLTDAGVSILFDLSYVAGWNFRKERKMRSIGLGPYAKIFNEEAYFGPTVAWVELSGSAFYTSYVQIAYLRRFYPVNGSTKLKQVEDGKTIRLANDNMFFEFFINSNHDNFFKYLAIRGGVLVPLTWSKGSFDDIQFRITIAVPVDGIFSY